MKKKFSTLSLLRVNEILESDDQEEINKSIGFILTVLRDNCLDDEIYLLLDKLLKKVK